MDVNSLRRFTSRRVCYLRPGSFDSESATAIDCVLRGLGVAPGEIRRLAAVERARRAADEVERLRNDPATPWFNASEDDTRASLVLLGTTDAVFRSLYAPVRHEAQLLGPVASWLRAHDLRPYAEIPMGRNRIDLLGYRKPAGSDSIELIGVELKNDMNQLKRGLDQMSTFQDYCHDVYLACTPALAAEYVFEHARALGVRRWDPHVLDRKLLRMGVGMLLVERDEVDRYIIPDRSRLDIGKIIEVLEFVHQREPVDV